MALPGSRCGFPGSDAVPWPGRDRTGDDVGRGLPDICRAVATRSASGGGAGGALAAFPRATLVGSMAEGNSDSVDLVALRPAEVDLRQVPCLVCGEPVGPAPQKCGLCGGLHHFDCWEYSKGCGRFGCRKAPVAAGPARTPEGKIGMPRRRAGAYAGYRWAPVLPTLTFYLAQLGAMLAFTVGDLDITLKLAALMVVCYAWILASSVRFYLDLDKRQVSQALALLDWEVEERSVVAFDALERFELMEVPGDRGRRAYEAVAVRVGPGEPVSLAPPLEEGSPELAELVDLFRRLEASSVFPVRLAPELVPAPPAPELTGGRLGSD